MQKRPVSKDVRALDVSDVVTLGQWLTQYRHLENPDMTDSKALLDVFVRSTREYEGDFGVFMPNELG
jgi:hypothetical protein